MNNTVVNLINGDFEVLSTDLFEAWNRGLGLLSKQMISCEEFETKLIPIWDALWSKLTKHLDNPT